MMKTTVINTDYFLFRLITKLNIFSLIKGYNIKKKQVLNRQYRGQRMRPYIRDKYSTSSFGTITELLAEIWKNLDKK
jgi:hypothetical protein